MAIVSLSGSKWGAEASGPPAKANREDPSTEGAMHSQDFAQGDEMPVSCWPQAFLSQTWALSTGSSNVLPGYGAGNGAAPGAHCPPGQEN